MNNFFPNNLKYLRNKKNMTQLELAKRMDKDYSTIGKWELGQRNPIMADILKLSELFNIPVQDLISKDLRLKEKNIDLPKLSEEEILRLFKQEFIKKGFLDENEEMTKETFDNLIEFAKINKKFIMKDEDKK